MPPAKKPKVAADPKQTTLFKHISGVPPPKKEQPTLAGLWGKKATDPEPATEKAEPEANAMAVDDAPIASSSKTAAASGDEEPKARPSPAKKARASSPPVPGPASSAPEPSTSAGKPTSGAETSAPSASSDEDDEAPIKVASKRKRSAVKALSSDGESEDGADKKGKAWSPPRKRSSSPAKRPELLEELEGSSGEDELEMSDIDSAAEDLPVKTKAKAKGKAASASAANMALLKDKEFAAAKEYPVWGPQDAVPYAALAHCFQKIESTTKRLLITEYLTEFLVLVVARAAPALAKGEAEKVLEKGKKAPALMGKGATGAESLLTVIYLCINRLCPDYEGIELGIGEAILMKAIGEAYGRSLSQVKLDLGKEGDLGKVAQISRTKQKTMFKPKPLTVPNVFAKLTEIAKISGNSAQNRKVGIIMQLLAASEGEEAKFVVRALSGKMRLGLAERTVVVALAHASVIVRNKGAKLSSEQLKEKLDEGVGIVKAVYSELPNFNLIIPALLEFGTEGLRDKCKLTPGVPLKPMLAKPTKAITEVLDRFEGKRFTCEYKYDGERAQIHREEDGTITVYSRNSENMSAKYPDLVEQLPRAIKEGAKSFVLDCEAVAWDKTTKKLLPFQEITKRKRKDVKVEDITIKVHIFAFDILYLNGESLLQKELQERREILYENFIAVEGEFGFAKSSDGDSTEEIQQFLEESVKDSCEGLMVKMLDTVDSTYEPSRRSMNWLKLKKDYLAGVGDSLDLVVVGAYLGKGKRTNVYGAYLLACFDPETEEYQTVCKIGTGFSDEVLESNYQMLKELEMPKARRDIQIGGAKPDVWFEPKVVWEVLTADLSLSPIYTAGHGIVEERGISLRFPRFIRIRDDKDADQATTSDQIAEFYQSQAVVSASNKSKGGEDSFW